MKIFLNLIFIIVLSNISFSQNIDIIGETNKKEILESKHQSWFEENYKVYSPSPESLTELNEIFENENFNVEVYFGTWCSDSQREVPRLIKLLEMSDFNFDNLLLIGVGRDKKVPNISEKQSQKLNITNVPTIVVYQNGKEINRFVEYAQESLEQDLIKIFSKDTYKHSYQN